MNDDTQIRSGKLTYLLWCLEGTVVVKLTTTEGAPPVRVSCPLCVNTGKSFHATQHSERFAWTTP